LHESPKKSAVSKNDSTIKRQNNCGNYQNEELEKIHETQFNKYKRKKKKQNEGW